MTIHTVTSICMPSIEEALLTYAEVTPNGIRE